MRQVTGAGRGSGDESGCAGRPSRPDGGCGGPEYYEGGGAEEDDGGSGGAAVCRPRAWPVAGGEELEALLTGELVGELSRLCAEAERENPLSEVLKRERVRLRRGREGYAEANCPGPRHDLRSPTLEVRLSRPDYYFCGACGAGGDVFSFAGLVHGVASLAEQFRKVTGRELSAGASPEYAEAVRRAARFRKEEVLGDASGARNLAPVYEALLERLPVSEDHFQLVRSHYGLAEEEFLAVWPAHRYRTLPAGIAERMALCDELADDGYDLRGVPGFFRIFGDVPDLGARDRWCVGCDADERRSAGGEMTELAGLVVPVRDPAGRVANLEVHNDPPPRGPQARPRAVWLPERGEFAAGPHSGARGSAGGARLHFAPPPRGGGRRSGTLVVAEGALKADVLSFRTGGYVLGVPCFGMLTDETLEVASRYDSLVVVADGGDARRAELLCDEARRLGLKTALRLYELPDGSAFHALAGLAVAPARPEEFGG